MKMCYNLGVRLSNCLSEAGNFTRNTFLLVHARIAFIVGTLTVGTQLIHAKCQAVMGKYKMIHFIQCRFTSPTLNKICLMSY